MTRGEKIARQSIEESFGTSPNFTRRERMLANAVRFLQEQNAVKQERERIALLEKALAPFAAIAPAFKEWRFGNNSFPLQSAHPKHKAILRKSWPYNENTAQFRELYPDDFFNAENLLKGAKS